MQRTAKEPLKMLWGKGRRGTLVRRAMDHLKKTEMGPIHPSLPGTLRNGIMSLADNTSTKVIWSVA